jgi:mono/diheme cytochrome c family protein
MRARTIHRCVLLLGGLAALAGCRQEMASQPSYRPLKPSAFFADGRSARPLVEGTVSRGELRRDRAYYTGHAGGIATTPKEAAGLIAAPGLPAAGALAATAQKETYLDYLPFPQEEMGKRLARGQERFNIYCAVCHGRDGDGEGMIPQRGFTKPPNFHTDLSRGFRHKGIDLPLREAPVGYLFEVISHGYGAMPDYREQVPVDDRWAIIAYVRALQFSRHAPLSAVRSEADRKRLEAEREKP